MPLRAPARERIDWKAIRPTIDLAAVAARLLGPPPGRRGERSPRKLWWNCPLGTHDDRNPSFAVPEAGEWWHCYGCGESGDAASLVMRCLVLTFPEALDYLTGRTPGAGRTRPRPTPARRPEASPRPDPGPSPAGLTEAEALVLVDEAAARLWSPEAADALRYLTGPRRLDPATIRAARLGWTPGVQLRTRDGRPYPALGVVIPWLVGGLPALVKVRQPSGRSPKYCEAFRNPARPPRLYPDRAIRPGRPAVIVEGEFDALLLGQALGELAGVVTLGSASARPEPTILSPLLDACPWYIATDADPAGDRSAENWLDFPRARRIRPPGAFNDWTEAATGPEATAAVGVDLRRWWSDILAGIDRPPLYTWDELAGWRWGPAADDPEPGIVIAPPDPGPRPAVLADALTSVTNPRIKNPSVCPLT